MLLPVELTRVVVPLRPATALADRVHRDEELVEVPLLAGHRVGHGEPAVNVKLMVAVQAD